jgi:hypothetical protein
VDKKLFTEVPWGYTIFDAFLIKLILPWRGLASVSSTQRKNMDYTEYVGGGPLLLCSLVTEALL